MPRMIRELNDRSGCRVRTRAASTNADCEAPHVVTTDELTGVRGAAVSSTVLGT